MDFTKQKDFRCCLRTCRKVNYFKFACNTSSKTEQVTQTDVFTTYNVTHDALLHQATHRLSITIGVLVNTNCKDVFEVFLCVTERNY